VLVLREERHAFPGIRKGRERQRRRPVEADQAQGGTRLAHGDRGRRHGNGVVCVRGGIRTGSAQRERASGQTGRNLHLRCDSKHAYEVLLEMNSMTCLLKRPEYAPPYGSRFVVTSERVRCHRSMTSSLRGARYPETDRAP